MKVWRYRIVSILWAVLIYRVTTIPQVVVTENTLLQNIIYGSAHFIFFGILAVFLYFSSLSITLSVILSSIYGLSIELIQRSLPGRTADPLDWFLDTLGAVVFLAIIGIQEGKEHQT